MVRTGRLIGLVAGAAFVAASIAAARDAPARQPAPVVGYFSLQPDLRLCPSPACGGVFASLLNRRLTPCPDGVQREACHASQVDWSRLHLDAATQEKLETAVLAGRGLVRGELHRGRRVGGLGPLGKLVVTEGWIAATDRRPLGSFFEVAANGIVCVAAPCFSLRERVLNTERSRPLSGLDFSASGAGERTIRTAWHEVHTRSILAAGGNRTVPDAGPAGDGVELVVTQFYLRVPRPRAPR
jgi:hypothetical protein